MLRANQILADNKRLLCQQSNVMEALCHAAKKRRLSPLRIQGPLPGALSPLAIETGEANSDVDFTDLFDSPAQTAPAPNRPEIGLVLRELQDIKAQLQLNAPPALPPTGPSVISLLQKVAAQTQHADPTVLSLLRSIHQDNRNHARVAVPPPADPAVLLALHQIKHHTTSLVSSPDPEVMELLRAITTEVQRPPPPTDPNVLRLLSQCAIQTKDADAGVMCLLRGIQADTAANARALTVLQNTVGSLRQCECHLSAIRRSTQETHELVSCNLQDQQIQLQTALGAYPRVSPAQTAKSPSPTSAAPPSHVKALPTCKSFLGVEHTDTKSPDVFIPSSQETGFWEAVDGVKKSGATRPSPTQQPANPAPCALLEFEQNCSPNSSPVASQDLTMSQVCYQRQMAFYAQNAQFSQQTDGGEYGSHFQSQN